VFVGDSAEAAEAIAGWLSGQGLPAAAGPRPPDADPSADGFEVWVRDSGQAETARGLVESAMRRAEARLREERLAKAPPVEVVCEDCGGVNTYLGKERGTVQSCRHCEAYVDVPDEDEADGEEWKADEAE
jgi:hypothetical protein